MNMNEISPKAKVRLNRIIIVSRCFRAAFFTFTLLAAVTTLWCSAGLVFVQRHDIGEVMRFSLAAGTNFACAVWAWFCYRLFNLYSSGDLFSSKIVQYIRRIGGLCFIAMLAQFLCKLFLPGYTEPLETPPGWGWTEWLGLVFYLFPSLLILFIAWIMDEGRKIQEEQELTV